MSKKPYGLHWFRRDLRVAGNIALQNNWKQNQGRVVGVFCFDKKFLGRDDFSVNRFQFFIESLIALQKELRQLGSDLLFMDEGPADAFPQLLEKLKKQREQLPGLITWGRDYEPFARQRDQAMVDLFKKWSIPTQIHRDHLLIEPEELTKKGTSDQHYQVYSPFARRWLEIFQEEPVQNRIKVQKAGIGYLKKLKKGEAEKIFKLTWNQLLEDKTDYEKILQDYREKNGEKVTVPIPPTGSVEAFEQLSRFAKKIDAYKDKRDIPSEQATSKLSLYLKNGSITIPFIIAHLGLEPYKKKKSGRDTFFSELIWREFYYHILYHNPRVETEAFLPEYKKIKWMNNKDHFKAWQEGKTGYPIVDAGMRELKTTGWMHNRVRMIVASFLTKDLLIDWRWGEKHFMDLLLDGDLAPNNGGWQWAASTGCDPQPYFRIFNPWLQGKKFDPNGDYIKKFVPELAELEAAQLHEPVELEGYPAPIVDHYEMRDKALSVYKKAKGS